MKTLNQKLNDLVNEAVSLITTKLLSEDGRILIATEDQAFDNEAEELNTEYLNRVPEIVHTNEYEGNETYYPMLIIGDKHSCEVQVINLTGEVSNIDLFEMDIYNLTVLADYVRDKTDNPVYQEGYPA